MLVDAILFLIGLALLYYGAEWLVAGSSTIALRLGITPLVVGCTVVAFGTSAPELVVSLAAVFTESDDISVGNIIGSNIANLALIIGVASVIRPIEIQSAIIKREFPVMLAATGVLCFVASDGTLSRIDGAVLLTLMVCYLVYMFIIARKEMASGATPDIAAEVEGFDTTSSSTGKDAAKIVFGIVGLTGGAYLMVDSAVAIATVLGVPQLIIGISIVAIGTSLPELATSTVAAARGESDISVGNVIGSNVFNSLMVLGVVAAIASVDVGQQAVDWDLWIMLGVTVLMWPIMWTRRRVGRGEGVFLLIVYFSYVIWLFLR